MVDSFGCERLTIVFMVIKSYYFGHIQVLKYVYIAGCSVTISMDIITLVNWTHEGHKLAWDDPVEVAILDFLVVLVFFRIKCLEIIPSKTKTFLESFQAVEDCAFVEAIAFAGISKGLEVWMVDLKLFVSLFCVHLEDDDHEGAHEEACVRDLCVVCAATVVVDSRLTLE